MRPFYIESERLTVDLEQVAAVGDLQNGGFFSLFQIYLPGNVVTVEERTEELQRLHFDLMRKWQGQDVEYIGPK